MAVHHTHIARQTTRRESLLTRASEARSLGGTADVAFASCGRAPLGCEPDAARACARRRAAAADSAAAPRSRRARALLCRKAQRTAGHAAAGACGVAVRLAARCDIGAGVPRGRCSALNLLAPAQKLAVRTAQAPGRCVGPARATAVVYVSLTCALPRRRRSRPRRASVEVPRASPPLRPRRPLLRPRPPSAHRGAAQPRTASREETTKSRLLRHTVPRRSDHRKRALPPQRRRSRPLRRLRLLLLQPRRRCARAREPHLPRNLPPLSLLRRRNVQPPLLPLHRLPQCRLAAQPRRSRLLLTWRWFPGPSWPGWCGLTSHAVVLPRFLALF